MLVFLFSGRKYDLSPWSSKDISIKQNHNELVFRTCNTISREDCGSKGGNSCFYMDNKFYKLVSKWDSTPAVGTNEDNLPAVTFKNGDVLTEQPITGQYVFKCAPAGTPETFTLDAIVFKSLFKVTIESPKACPIASGLSGGWIFVIIFSILLLGYLIGGMVYAVKVQSKSFGISSLPGYSLWVALLSNVVSGVTYTFSSIKKCISGRKAMGDYESADYGTSEV